jgi:HD-GYP domain-containing protein (c-di-GMP phosphodiesterase class II)
VLEKKVTLQQLRPGMYVSRLDRPWLDTPFPLQGFPIRAAPDVAELRKHCEYVFIDVERGLDAPSEAQDPPRPPASVTPAPVDAQRELPVAKLSVERVSTELVDIFEGARARRPIQTDRLKSGITGLVDSALRSTDAALLLARLKRKDSYAYMHALSCSLLAVVLGKQLMLQRAELLRLALAATLFDIGKTQVPDELLVKTGPMTPPELKVLQRHVQFGVKVLKEARGIDSSTIDAARHHHERHDGSGYPAGLAGENIPLFARIVGLVDTYDAMTSTRVYRSAMSHETAIRELYDLRDRHFQNDLIEHLIQCLGTYPAGTLVELTNGEVGIVVEQNLVRRLRPKVMVILDADKSPLDHFPLVNLLAELEDARGEPLAIATTLAPGSYGIDPSEYFI